MNLLQEVEHKHALLKDVLKKHGAEALWLRRIRNVAWITAGADSSIPIDAEFGVYSVVITASRRIVFTNNIEAQRIHGEESLDDLGFEFIEWPWHKSETPDFANMIVDDGDVEADVQQHRRVLGEGERQRYRQLCKDTASIIEAAARAVQPGETEFDIAARMDAGCRKMGGVATVNLIAVDDRIAKYRHPLATFQRLDKLAMLILCMRRGGLITAVTRFVHIGPVPDELQEKMNTVAAIDAVVIAASRPGRTLGDVFRDLQAAYKAQGQDDQWMLHHQGGLIGYIGRERIATPGDRTVLRAYHALAWNPSIVGAKSEDTILIDDSGFEVLTWGDYPTIDVNVGGETIQRAGILTL
jgi:antitoxin VapB